VVQFRELDDRVTFASQLADSGGPMVFITRSRSLQRTWTGSWKRGRPMGKFMMRQPGFVSTQLHRGIAGSTTFINVAEGESVEAFRAAASNPEFRSSLSRYPDSSVASPHIFTKGAVPVICGG
jgi:hypothetical protein